MFHITPIPTLSKLYDVVYDITPAQTHSHLNDRVNRYDVRKSVQLSSTVGPESLFICLNLTGSEAFADDNGVVNFFLVTEVKVEGWWVITTFSSVKNVMIGQRSSRLIEDSTRRYNLDRLFEKR